MTIINFGKHTFYIFLTYKYVIKSMFLQTENNYCNFIPNIFTDKIMRQLDTKLHPYQSEICTFIFLTLLPIGYSVNLY